MEEEKVLIIEEEDQDERGYPLDSWHGHSNTSTSTHNRDGEAGEEQDEEDHPELPHDDEVVGTGKQVDDEEQEEEEYESDESDEIVIDLEAEEAARQAELEQMTASERAQLEMEEYRKTRSQQVKVFDEYGFEMPEGTMPNIPTPEEQEVILRRVEKWETMLQDWPTWKKKKEKKIKQRCKKGIPNTVRGRAWQTISGSFLLMQQFPHTYKIILGEETNLRDIDTIERDLDRTYPDHYEFMDQDGRGQNKLFNVLKAFTHYRPKTGYVQGMAMLVGLMLMYMGEEEAFWLMVTLNDYYIPGLFDRNLSQFHVDLGIFDDLLQRRLPKLHAHLQDFDIHPSLYVTKWLLCIFTVSLPWETVLRVWDVFLIEGMKWFFTLALSIMTLLEEQLLECSQEGIIMTLQQGSENFSHEQLFPIAEKINISSKEFESAHARQLKIMEEGGGF